MILSLVLVGVSDPDSLDLDSGSLGPIWTQVFKKTDIISGEKTSKFLWLFTSDTVWVKLGENKIDQKTTNIFWPKLKEKCSVLERKHLQ